MVVKYSMVFRELSTNTTKQNLEEITKNSDIRQLTKSKNGSLRVILDLM
jgi:hypothetical protein